jgi:hypothetical protein
MIKAFSAIAAAAFIAAALTVLPGFAPQVEASVPQALAKGDRLDIRTVGKDCSQQAWPNFEASCLRAAGSKLVVKEARLVASRLLWFEVLGMPPGTSSIPALSSTVRRRAKGYPDNRTPMAICVVSSQTAA